MGDICKHSLWHRRRIPSICSKRCPSSEAFAIFASVSVGNLSIVLEPFRLTESIDANKLLSRFCWKERKSSKYVIQMGFRLTGHGNGSDCDWQKTNNRSTKEKSLSRVLFFVCFLFAWVMLENAHRFVVVVAVCHRRWYGGIIRSTASSRLAVNSFGRKFHQSYTRPKPLNCFFVSVSEAKNA